jgi:hypothetical protein
VCAASVYSSSDYVLTCVYTAHTLHLLLLLSLHYCKADSKMEASPLVIVNAGQAAASVYLRELEVTALHHPERERSKKSPALSIELLSPLHLRLQPGTHVELRQVLLRSHAKHAHQSGMQLTAHITVEFGSDKQHKQVAASAKLLKVEVLENGKRSEKVTLYTAAGIRRKKDGDSAPRRP